MRSVDELVAIYRGGARPQITPAEWRSLLVAEEQTAELLEEIRGARRVLPMRKEPKDVGLLFYTGSEVG